MLSGIFIGSTQTEIFMKLFLPIILIIFITGTGCLKRDERNVNAPCTDSCITFLVKVNTGLNSSTPLRNARVELGWSRPATPIGDAGRLIATGTTDNNGFILMRFAAKDKELTSGRYYIAVKNGDDYFYQMDTYYGVEKRDTTLSVNVHVPSKATIKIVYKNFNPTDSADYFQAGPYFLSYGSMGHPVEMKNSAGQPSNTHFFPTDGSYNRLELSGTTAGDQYTYIGILRKKNGVREDVIDSIYIPKGESKTYEVSF